MGGRLAGGVGGLGGDQVPHVGVHIVDGLVVVVGVVPQNLLDTGRSAPHPPDPRDPSCLPALAHVTPPFLSPCALALPSAPGTVAPSPVCPPDCVLCPSLCPSHSCCR